MSKKIRELISENHYLSTIINSANEGIYVTDRDRKFLIWNDASERMTGFRREDVIGKYCHNNILDHTNEEGTSLCSTDCPLAKSMTGNCLHGPDIVYLRHKDGRRIPVEVKTAPLLDKNEDVIGSVEIFHDITERIERERALAEKTMKLETVMDNICDGVLFIDHVGNISLFNKALADMLFLDKSLPGKNIFSLPSDDPLKEAIFRVNESFKGQFCWEKFNCSDDVTCLERGSDSGRCWLKCSGSTSRLHLSCNECPVYLEMKTFLERPKDLTIGSKLISVLSSFIEFRDKKQIWEVIVFKEVTSEKLDAVTSLAGAAAHELRQPLQIIISFLSLLRDETGDNEMMVKYSDAIEESCMRMDGIIKKLCNVTQYRLKDYSEDLKILDLVKSSDNAEKEPGS